MYDLIILGGGPAGLTATVYAIHKRLETLLISEDLGGKSNYRMHIRGLEGYETINGEEVVRRFQSQVEYLDFARLIDKAVAVELLANGNGEEYIKVTTESGTAFVTRSLIIATGAQPRMLNVPGERSLLGLGVSYSAISHAPLFWGKETAVVGSDSLAFRAVTELATLASRVSSWCHKTRCQPTCLWLDKIRRFDNVIVLEETAVVSVGGSPHLEEMTVRRANGRKETLAVKGMFVELGLIPNTGLLNGIVDLDEQGRVVVDCRGATSRPGIYAAGDVTSSYAEQVLIAVGDGAKAALSAYEYLLSRRQFKAQPVLVR